MRIGSSSSLPLPIPATVERDAAVVRGPARDHAPVTRIDEITEEPRKSESRRRPSQRVDGIERVSRQQFSRVKDFSELPANNRNAIAAYTQTQRLASPDGTGELVGIDELV